MFIRMRALFVAIVTDLQAIAAKALRCLRNAHVPLVGVEFVVRSSLIKRARIRVVMETNNSTSRIISQFRLRQRQRKSHNAS